MALKSHMADALRRSYDFLALLALLHMAALGGFAAYLFSTGTLNMTKLQEVSAVLRGRERGAPQTPPDRAANGAPSESAQAEAPASNGIAALERADLLRWEAERVKTELDQRLALNNSIMLRVTAEKAAFEQKRDQAQKRDEAARAEMRDEGFQKQVAIYEGLAPKIAIEHLLALGSHDEAARILLQMDTRKARKIVEAAKRGQQLISMQQILERVREVAPNRSPDFEEE